MESTVYLTCLIILLSSTTCWLSTATEQSRIAWHQDAKQCIRQMQRNLHAVGWITSVDSEASNFANKTCFHDSDPCVYILNSKKLQAFAGIIHPNAGIAARRVIVVCDGATDYVKSKQLMFESEKKYSALIFLGLVKASECKGEAYTFKLHEFLTGDVRYPRVRRAVGDTSSSPALVVSPDVTSAANSASTAQSSSQSTGTIAASLTTTPSPANSVSPGGSHALQSSSSTLATTVAVKTSTGVTSSKLNLASSSTTSFSVASRSETVKMSPSITASESPRTTLAATPMTTSSSAVVMESKGSVVIPTIFSSKVTDSVTLKSSSAASASSSSLGKETSAGTQSSSMGASPLGTMTTPMLTTVSRSMTQSTAVMASSLSTQIVKSVSRTSKTPEATPKSSSTSSMLKPTPQPSSASLASSSPSSSSSSPRSSSPSFLRSTIPPSSSPSSTSAPASSSSLAASVVSSSPVSSSSSSSLRASAASSSPLSSSRPSPSSSSSFSPSPTPSPTQPPPPVHYFKLKLNGQCSLTSNKTALEDLKMQIRKKVSATLGLPLASVIITDVTCGSIIVDFSVKSPPNNTDAVLSNTFNKNFTLTVGNSTIAAQEFQRVAAPSTSILSSSPTKALPSTSATSSPVKSTSSKMAATSSIMPSPSPSPTKKPTDRKDNELILYIAIGCVGGIILLVVVVAIVVNCRKKTNKNALKFNDTVAYELGSFNSIPRAKVKMYGADQDTKNENDDLPYSGYTSSPIDTRLRLQDDQLSGSRDNLIGQNGKSKGIDNPGLVYGDNA